MRRFKKRRWDKRLRTDMHEDKTLAYIYEDRPNQYIRNEVLKLLDTMEKAQVYFTKKIGATSKN